MASTPYAVRRPSSQATDLLPTGNPSKKRSLGHKYLKKNVIFFGRADKQFKKVIKNKT